MSFEIVKQINPNDHKVLGQSAPTAITLTDLYTVPSGKVVYCSTLYVCNRGAGASTFRVAVAVAGAADATKQYIYYDLEISGNNSFAADVGISLQPTDVVRVYASSGNLSFSLFGAEVT